MAVKEFKLPDVGEGVAEGELVRWLVAPGDEVSEDQPVAEVETDKALVEVPSPYDGSVRELRAEEGDVVPVGDVIITFDVPDEAAEGDEGQPEVEPQPADSAARRDEAATDAAEVEGDEAASGAAEVEGDEAEAGPSGETDETAEVGAEPAAEDGTVAETGDAGAPPGEQATAETDEAEPASGRVFAPPSVRRLARELGVDVGTVEGTGPGGRITESDVREAAEGGAEEASAGADSSAGGAETAAEETAEAAPEPAGRERTLAAPATRRLAGEEGVDIDDVPASGTRDGEAYVTADDIRAYADAQRAAREAETASGEGTGAPSEPAAAPETEPAAETAATSETAASAEAAPSAETAPSDDTGPAAGERVPYRGVRRSIGDQMVRSAFTAPHVTHHDQMDATELVAIRDEYREVAAERDVKLTYMAFVMKAVVAALKEFPYLNATLDEDEEEIVLREEYNVGVAVATDAGLMVPVVRNVDRKGLLTIAREVTGLAEKARNRSISRAEMQGSTFTITNFGAIGGEYATPIINHPEVAILGLGRMEERPWAENGEVVARTTLPLSLSIDHRVVDGAMAAEFTNRLMEYLTNPKLLLLE